MTAAASVAYLDLGIVGRRLVILPIDNVSAIVLAIVVVVDVRNGNPFRGFRPAATSFRIRVRIWRCRKVVALNTRWITGSWPETNSIEKIESNARPH